jgi:DNA mismatch endonuclease (patch repair protein)
MMRTPHLVETVPFKRGVGTTTAQRSAQMAAVRQSRTKPEELVAAALRDLGFAYRRNDRRLPGSPDFANRRRGFAVLVHGCYWHRHPHCSRTTTPTRNREFWEEKFVANQARDRRKAEQLDALGLRAVTVWECETEDPAQLRRILISGLAGL